MRSPPEMHRDLRTFRDALAKYSAHERHVLSHIKRFCECFAGDPQFRRKLEENMRQPQVVADEFRIDVDPELMRPLFDVEYSSFRFKSADDRWPLARMWDMYLTLLEREHDAVREVARTAESNPRFGVWRSRQVNRLKSELGSPMYKIVAHALAAFELSQGCTMGCWFCGLSADKFQGYFPYTPENEKLWRGSLEAIRARFGAALQTAFSYWATDPSDNPDYARFIRAQYEVTGCLPQTTTANPLRNVQQTRDILATSAELGAFPDRFSILSVGQLRRVHQAFSPEELLGVQLVFQNKDSLHLKVNAGKALTPDASGSSAAVTASEGRSSEPGLYDGTIACVSGFLVNFMERKIRLISPARADKRWPDGYRIYGEATFEDEHELGEAIDALVDAQPESLRGRDRLRFRGDLEYEALADGFAAKNDRSVAKLTGQPWYGAVGQCLADGTMTMAEIVAKTAGGGGVQAAAIGALLNELFKAGLLDDDPLYGGIDNDGVPVSGAPRERSVQGGLALSMHAERAQASAEEIR